MNKVLLFAIVLLYLSGLSRVNAQYNLPENNIWAFGYHTGMNVSAQTPFPVTTSMNNFEGCASVCNANGTLLFYSNGSKVWGANGSLFPHGQNLDIPSMITITTTQAALIVPIPGQINKYYLFTLGTKLFCYKIDMALNNGNGDVDTTFALTHVPLKDSLAEKMIAIPGCDNNVWVIVKPLHADQFYSFNITTQGIDTAVVVSNAGYSVPQEYFQGAIAASHDGHRIVANTASKVELFNFDKTNGKISNYKILDNLFGYSSCFSPDGKLLYVNASYVYQYNLEECNPAETKLNLGSAFLSDIRLAPNGKIYFRSIVSLSDQAYLGSIENPNILGSGCLFRDSVPETAMPIVNPTTLNFSMGLSNTVVKANMEEQSLNRKYFDTCICKFPYSTGLTLVSAPGFSNYQWSDGSSTATLNVQNRGKYWVSYVTSCGRRFDTFTVRGSIEQVSLTYNAPLLLTSGIYQSYKWYKDGILIAGAISATYTPVANGIYSVVVSNAESCTDSTFIHVTVNPTGIGEYDNLIKVSVYPNPATDMIYIESATRLQALITDLSGRVLIEARHGKAFDISKLQSGAYFIKIMNDAGELVTIRKFIKMKQ